MTHIPTLPATRAYYDTVAEDYAERVRLPFAQDVLGRAMLGAFADEVRADAEAVRADADAVNADADAVRAGIDEVRADSALRVADLGCGPGHVAAHLVSLGLRVHGVDVSPRMVDIARRSHPDLRFEVGSMDALGFPDGALGGIVAWWSILHTPPDLLPLLFAEFRRVLTPGGRLLLGFHAGDGQPYTGKKRDNGVAYAIHLLEPDRVGTQLEEAGFTVTANLLGEGEKWPQACVFAQATAVGAGAATVGAAAGAEAEVGAGTRSGSGSGSGPGSGAGRRAGAGARAGASRE